MTRDGIMVMLHTLARYRRRGYAGLVVQAAARELLARGITPMAGVQVGEELTIASNVSNFCRSLPASKPTGHRTVRVVVVVGGDYFEVLTLKVDLRSTSTFFPCLSM